MDLQILNGVDHLDAFALEQIGVFDVLLLVETRLQLDEHRDRLPFLAALIRAFITFECSAVR